MIEPSLGVGVRSDRVYAVGVRNDRALAVGVRNDKSLGCWGQE